MPLSIPQRESESMSAPASKNGGTYPATEIDFDWSRLPSFGLTSFDWPTLVGEGERKKRLKKQTE